MIAISQDGTKKVKAESAYAVYSRNGYTILVAPKKGVYLVRMARYRNQDRAFDVLREFIAARDNETETEFRFPK